MHFRPEGLEALVMWLAEIAAARHIEDLRKQPEADDPVLVPVPVPVRDE